MTESNPPTGRPKLPANRKRSQRRYISMTEQEAQIVDRAAALLDRDSTGAFLYEIVHHYIDHISAKSQAAYEAIFKEQYAMCWRDFINARCADPQERMTYSPTVEEQADLEARAKEATETAVKTRLKELLSFGTSRPLSEVQGAVR